MIAKLNQSNIYDGCLSELRSILTDKLPPNRHWLNGTGIKNLVGNHEVVNEHNVPWEEGPPAYYKIFFGDHFIQPISYSLMGRRAFPNNCIKGWDFFGLTRNDEWKFLDGHNKSHFQPFEEIIYTISEKESYKGFMLNMTEPDTENEWCLCIGLIEVHGYIFDHYFVLGLETLWTYSLRISISLSTYVFFLH